MTEEKTERRRYVLNVDFPDKHVLHLNKYEVLACDTYDPFDFKKPEHGGPIFLTRETAKAILEKVVYWFWNKKEITRVGLCPFCQKKQKWDLGR